MKSHHRYQAVAVRGMSHKTVPANAEKQARVLELMMQAGAAMGDSFNLVSVAILKSAQPVVMMIITIAAAVVRGNMLEKRGAATVRCCGALSQGKSILYDKKTVNPQLVSLQCGTSETNGQCGAKVISLHSWHGSIRDKLSPTTLSLKVCLQKSLPCKPRLARQWWL